MEDDPKVEELLKRMTPEQKLNTAAKMYWNARALRAGALRTFHPDWSEEKIQQQVRFEFLTARD
jgi:hypothetical protein